MSTSSCTAQNTISGQTAKFTAMKTLKPFIHAMPKPALSTVKAVFLVNFATCVSLLA
jgi:hypothetical protein